MMITLHKTNKKDIEYINLNGKLIAKLEQKIGTTRKNTYYHYDLLGSPVATTNQAGGVLWREEYSPWGEKLLKEDASHDNVRDYTGHVHDKETGLTYMQARYYDPQIGRFMGIDPVGFQGGNTISFNRYKYGNNNPFKFTDPNGEYESEIAYEDGSSMDMPVGDSSTPMDLAGPPEEKKERVERGFFAKSWDRHGYHALGSLDAFPGARTVKAGALGLMALGSIKKVAPIPAKIYRSASGTPASMTPRAKDIKGLSASSTLEKALSGKNQIIDTSKLKNLCAHCDNIKTGHISITPKDMSQMKGWINSRGSNNTHALTQELMNAVIGTVKK